MMTMFKMSKKERKEWKAISSDEDAKQFIDLFWAKRDPNLDTPINEFRVEFDLRVTVADENFTWEKQRGAITDRAKVLILLGNPHQKQRRAPTETVSMMDDRITDDEVRAAARLWNYDPARMPEKLKIKGSRVLFVFYEEKAESGNFVLDRSHQYAALAMRALGRAPGIYIYNPDLTEVPKPVSVPGGEPASAAQLAWLDLPSAQWTDKALVLAEAGLAGTVFRPLWLHIELPEEAPEIDLLAGRVSSAAGEVLSTFQIPASPLSTEFGRAHHLGFALEAGTYQVEVAAAAGGEPLVLVSSETELPSLPAEGTWFSPLWLGLEAEHEEGVALGMPFNFGGWHLRPLAGGNVSLQSELSYFGFLIRPGLGDNGNVSLRGRIILKKDGKRLGSPLSLALAAAPLGEDLYLYANALNLSGLPGPGEYNLKFTVTDNISKAKVERELVLNIVE